MHVKKRTKKLRKLLLLIADQLNIKIFLAFPRKRFRPKKHFLIAKLKSKIALLASGKLLVKTGFCFLLKLEFIKIVVLTTDV